jgi:hypothetical protein
MPARRAEVKGHGRALHTIAYRNMLTPRVIFIGHVANAALNAVYLTRNNIALHLHNDRGAQ